MQRDGESAKLGVSYADASPTMAATMLAGVVCLVRRTQAPSGRLSCRRR